MDERARDIANLLLREGALRPSNSEHQQIKFELTENPELYRKVRQRLEAVGYELVDRLTHLGVRVAPEAHDAAEMKNREGIHAGHIRLIVYLWVHLVYREWVEMRGDVEASEQASAPGREQGSLLPDDADEESNAYEPPSMSYERAERDFEEIYSNRQFKGYLTQLRNWHFITYDRRADTIEAASSLYTLVDRQAMEDFVVDIARRMGIEDVADAVTEVAARGQSLEADESSSSHEGQSS